MLWQITVRPQIPTISPTQHVQQSIEQQHALEAMHESVGIYLNIAVDEEHTTKHPDMQSRRLSLKDGVFM